jgi:hypothetical protein
LSAALDSGFDGGLEWHRRKGEVAMALKFGFRWVCSGWILALAGMVGLASCGGSVSQTVPPPPQVTVTVAPQLAAVAATTQTQQFTATVTGTTTSAVSWSVDTIENGNATVGAISSGGLYTPPAAAGMHTVTASSIANSIYSGSASVAVTNLAGVFTYHNDLSRDGANTQEYALTNTTVTTASFGKLFSCPRGWRSLHPTAVGAGAQHRRRNA